MKLKLALQQEQSADLRAEVKAAKKRQQEAETALAVLKLDVKKGKLTKADKEASEAPSVAPETPHGTEIHHRTKGTAGVPSSFALAGSMFASAGMGPRAPSEPAANVAAAVAGSAGLAERTDAESSAGGPYADGAAVGSPRS